MGPSLLTLSENEAAYPFSDAISEVSAMVPFITVLCVRNSESRTLSPNHRSSIWSESHRVERGSTAHYEKAVEFGDGEYFQSAAIRKAILLTKYAQILMQWIRSDESANAQSEHREHGQQQQQRRRRPLFVNDRYRLIFGRFLVDFWSILKQK